MNKGMDELFQELRESGSTGATPQFTQAVMSRLATRRMTRRRRQLVSALVTTAVLILAAGVLFDYMPRTESAVVDLRNETRRLRQEYSELERDLESLRASARETAPVLYLGGDDEVDLVLDLVPFILQPAPAATPAAGGGLDPYEL